MSIPSGGTTPLRIGNQEREAASAALDTHLQAGRLDADEYGERYAQATMARTREELDVLFLDLPAPHPFASRPSPTPTVSLTKGTGWIPPQARDWQPRVPASAVGRLAAALLLIAAVVIVVPLLAAGAILWFVIIPMLKGRCGHGRKRSLGRPAWH